MPLIVAFDHVEQWTDVWIKDDDGWQCVSAQSAIPQEKPAYQAWLDFFVGTWDIKWDGNWKPFTFRRAKGKYAVVGEASTSDGTRAIATYAWDAGKNALVFTWIDSHGEHARQEMTVIEEDRLSGLLYSSGPDGKITDSSTVRRHGDNKYTVTLQLVDENGTVTESKGVMTRRK